MRRIMLKVAYDGTDYAGWQMQPNKLTIEGVLNDELSKLLGEDIKVIGASRTDSGVHALGAVCVFDTESKIPGEKFSYAINQSLPNDIRVRESKEVDPDFHPRRTGSRKTYRYSIRHDEFSNPLYERYSHLIYTELDIEEMRRACGFFVGKHDFKSFCSVHTDVDTTVRTVYDVHIDVTKDKKLLQMNGLMKGRGSGNSDNSGDGDDVVGSDGSGESSLHNAAVAAGDFRKNPEMIDIYVTGNGFLYNMVRIIAGTLIDVGQGRIKADDIPRIIEACDREKAGQTAPAKGLTLVGYLFR